MDRFDKFTDRARTVLTLAQDEAVRLDHNYIGTEHIVLGLLRVEDGVACRVLRVRGVELDKARTAVEFIAAGTDYVARPAGASSTERETKGEILITPAPPEGAVLIVEVTAFEERRFPWQAAEWPGSWQFEISLS